MLDKLSLFGQQTSLLEIVAMLTGIFAVWLTAKKSIACFPLGMINVALYSWLFFSPEVRLYADGLLQIIFFVLLAYGWINWKKDKGNTAFEKISRFPKQQYLILVSILIVGSYVTGYLFHHYTAASYPYLDSTLTVTSLIAQWMIAKKYIDNWYLWIFADIIYIPLYFIKQLPLTSVLYFIFLLLCIVGYRDWKKELHVS